MELGWNHSSKVNMESDLSNDSVATFSAAP
jgi:hypothetical protein